MKVNIFFPATGCLKLIEVDDERKLHTFYEKPMATEVVADALGEEWKGYQSCPIPKCGRMIVSDPDLPSLSLGPGPYRMSLEMQREAAVGRGEEGKAR
uniref:Small ribosomal subunit protein eS6 n=1 Tax=Canis lupus dingo TaxID=286419 RepID=A0A8C0KW77_CANLU